MYCSKQCFNKYTLAPILEIPIADLEGETWRPVVGYEGLYDVSNLGRVKSLQREIVNAKNKTLILKKKILKQQMSIRGYPYVDFRVQKVRTKFTIHRLVAMAFIPNPKNKKCVNHINSIRHDNRAENLEWCTHKENIAHGRDFGFFLVGDKRKTAKLTSNQAECIRKAYNEDNKGETELSREYGVSRGIIQSILKNKTYKGVI
jgi:hypothetical protein